MKSQVIKGPQLALPVVVDHKLEIECKSGREYRGPRAGRKIRKTVVVVRARWTCTTCKVSGPWTTPEEANREGDAHTGAKK